MRSLGTTLWIYDHFYPMSQGTSTNILEAWTVLPLLALETKEIRFGVLVTCNSYRIPSVLAKIAATVDVVSGGRLEFGIGAGWHVEEYKAYGIPFPNAQIRISQLDEAICLIKHIWTQDRASFQGKYYTINDLTSTPKPLQKPYPPIWIGGKGDKLLKVAAKHADNINLIETTEEETGKRLALFNEYCNEGGRPFANITKSWFGLIIIDENNNKARQKAIKEKNTSLIPTTKEMTLHEFLSANIVGTPNYCIEKIQRYIDEGITYFTFYFPSSNDLSVHRIFTKKIMPSFT